MLSIETPPDPSCSYKPSPPLNADERDSDPTGCAEAQDPNFSIRDYAFSCRRKAIATSWPFDQQFLKLCLKHGASAILPPFEPPDLVRAQCSRKTVETKLLEAEDISAQAPSLDHIDACTKSIELESCLPSADLAVESPDPDQARYRLPKQQRQGFDEKDTVDDKLTYNDAEVVSTVTNQDSIKIISDQISEFHVSTSPSEASSQLEVSELPTFPPAKLRISREPTEKKFRLVLKLSVISDARPTEDVASTSSVVSDPMASKVCPVCKIFSSTSNTTLNAHIDQCLSTESDPQQIETNVSKFQVKPRKKRLMVDIYATAPYCTLEELDRRNGTSWATDLSLVAPLVVEANTETKRLKLAPVVTRDDVNEEGAVYVDSNGIKLRILSKFNDTPQVMPSEALKPKKHTKGIKEGKSQLTSKKKQFSPKYLKYMSVKVPHKKLRSFDLYKRQMQAEQEGDNQADMPQEKEESQLQAVSPVDQVKNSGPSMLRPWACSKRSDLHKKMNKMDIHKISEKPRHGTRTPLSESNQPDFCSSPLKKNHKLNFSRSSEALTSIPKSKRIDSLRTMGSGMKKSPNAPMPSSRWSSEGTSTSALLLKLPRSSGSSPSCPSSNREEIAMRSTHEADNSFGMSARSSETYPPSLKTKQKVNLKTSDLVRSPSFTLEMSNGDVIEKASNSKKLRKHRSNLASNRRGELPSDVTGAARTSKTQRCNISKSDTRSETEEIAKVTSPRTTILEPELANDGAATVGRVYNVVESMTKSSIKKTRDDHVSLEAPTPAPDDVAMAEANLSKEQSVQSILGSEPNNESGAQSLIDKKEVHHSDANHDEIASPNDQAADEIEFRGGSVEHQAETVSAQESSACLTSHGDVGLEVPQENSSVTSNRVVSDQGHTLASDGELSPVSTASTISPPSPKDSQSKDSETDVYMRQEITGGSQGRDIEEENHEVVMASAAKEAKKFPDDQPCCCSRWGSLSREFQYPRQSIIPGAMPPSQGKQVPHLYITPRISSFSSYQSSRTNAMESPTESITTKSSSDSGVRFPAYNVFASHSPSSTATTPSTPNPVLRLMGKNLMVVNKEEPSQFPVVYHSASDIQLTPLGFDNYCGQGSFWYPNHHQLPIGPSVVRQAPPIANQQMPFHAAGLMVQADHQIQNKRLNKKPNSPSASAHQHYQKAATPSSQAPYVKEVIVIDDSPETDHEPKASLVSPSSTLPAFPGSNTIMQQRPFSCFPSLSQFVSRDLSAGFGPSFLNAFPAKPMKQGTNTSEGLGPPILPSSFLFRSPSMNYSPNL